MTRRQFLACVLMAVIALVLLPLQKFAEWGERWFGHDSYEFRMMAYGNFLIQGPCPVLI